MQKVAVYKHVESNNLLALNKTLVGYGIFHGFGCDYEGFENGIGNFSTAIVEMRDGSLMNVPVELIVMKKETDTYDKDTNFVNQIRIAFFHQLERKTGWGRNEVKAIFETAVESAM